MLTKHLHAMELGNLFGNNTLKNKVFTFQVLLTFFKHIFNWHSISQNLSLVLKSKLNLKMQTVQINI